MTSVQSPEAICRKRDRWEGDRRGREVDKERGESEGGEDFITFRIRPYVYGCDVMWRR